MASPVESTVRNGPGSPCRSGKLASPALLTPPSPQTAAPAAPCDRALLAVRPCAESTVSGAADDVLARHSYVGEGFDDARLDTLFLALPVSWKGTLVQYADRLHRQRPGKTETRIYDYADVAVPVLSRMLERRLRGYRSLAYERSEGYTPRGPRRAS